MSPSEGVFAPHAEDDENNQIADNVVGTSVQKPGGNHAPDFPLEDMLGRESPHGDQLIEIGQDPSRKLTQESDQAEHPEDDAEERERVHSLLEIDFVREHPLVDGGNVFLLDVGLLRLVRIRSHDRLRGLALLAGVEEDPQCQRKATIEGSGRIGGEIENVTIEERELAVELTDQRPRVAVAVPTVNDVVGPEKSEHVAEKSAEQRKDQGIFLGDQEGLQLGVVAVPALAEDVVEVVFLEPSQRGSVRKKDGVVGGEDHELVFLEDVEESFGPIFIAVEMDVATGDQGDEDDDREEDAAKDPDGGQNRLGGFGELFVQSDDGADETANEQDENEEESHQRQERLKDVRGSFNEQDRIPLFVPDGILLVDGHHLLAEEKLVAAEGVVKSLGFVFTRSQRVILASRNGYLSGAFGAFDLFPRELFLELVVGSASRTVHRYRHEVVLCPCRSRENSEIEKSDVVNHRHIIVFSVEDFPVAILE